MEIENVNSKANAGLATGIIGTAGVGLALLAHGLGGWNNAAVNADYIGRQEMEHRLNDIQTIAAKDSEIAALKMNTATDSKVLDLYKYLETQLHSINNRFADQGVWNATAQGNFSTIAAQVATLQNTCNGLTKIVIPSENVCPEPMARYNSWTSPTSTNTGN